MTTHKKTPTQGNLYPKQVEPKTTRTKISQQNTPSIAILTYF